MIRAAAYKHGQIISMLIKAGAKTDVDDAKGRNFLDLCKTSLEWPLNSHDMASRHGPLNKDDKEPAMVQTLRLEIEALQNVIGQMELAKVIKVARKEREKLIKLHAKGQADYCVRNGVFDHSRIVSDILRKIVSVPLAKDNKTVAVWVRGTALPYKFAVGGWVPGPLGCSDGTLD